MASRKSRFHSSRPHPYQASPQAATHPGTEQLAGPASGTRVSPANRSRFNPPGAAPLPLTAVTAPSSWLWISRKASPPIPLAQGSTTASTAPAATTASIAFPPARRIAAPASAASG